MKPFDGKTISWLERDGAIELSLHRSPCNEIGSETLVELESFAAELRTSAAELHALIVHSAMPAGFCAGADLLELYRRTFEKPRPEENTFAEVRTFLER